MEADATPLTPGDAVELLTRARHRDDVFATLLRAVRSVTRCACLLTVRGDVAVGRIALGDGPFDDDVIAQVVIPLAQADALRRAVESASPSVGPIATADPEVSDAIGRLGDGVAANALVLPIHVRKRVMALVVGACDDTVGELTDVSELLPLAEATTDALIRLIMRTKARATTIDGEQAPRLQEQADLYLRSEMWEELAANLREQIAATRADDDRATLYKRLGHVLTTRLGRDPEALKAWQAAEQIDERDLETQRALCRLHRSLQQWEQLADALRGAVRAGTATGELADDEQLQLYAELGELEGTVLDRADRAVEAWRHLLAIDASDVRAMDALEQLYLREGRWDECAELLERRSLIVDDASVIYPLLQLADIFERQAKKPERAAAVYVRVLQLDPHNATASEHLVPILGELGRWDDVSRILVDRAEQCDTPGERIDILTDLARIYEHEQANPELAVVVIQTAFLEDCTDDTTAAELARLATATDQWTDVLRECADAAGRLESEEPLAATALWLRVGIWYDEHRGHIDNAIDAVQCALRLQPDNLAGLDVLQRLQQKRSSWIDAADTLAKRIAIEQDPLARSALQLSFAEGLEANLEDLAPAVEAYEKALAEDPTSIVALAALERLYRWHERWTELAQLLRRSIDVQSIEANTEELTRLRLELGEVLRDRLGDTDEAIAAFRDVLDGDPSNETSLTALERLYEGTDQPVQYLEVLEAQLESSTTPAQRVEKYLAMASAWDEQFGRADRAIASFNKVIAIDEANTAALAGLEQLHRKREDWEPLSEVYRAQARTSSKPQRRVAALVALADVYAQHLSDPEQALAVYDEVLAIDSDERRALAGVAELCEGSPDTDERAVAAMELLLHTVDDAAELAELRCRIGRIRIRHGDAQGAKSWFGEALAADAGHLAAVDGLVELAGQRGDWSAAAQALCAAAAATPSAQGKARLLLQAGAIYRERMRDSERAAHCFAQVLESDPDNIEAGQPLSELYFQAESWELLAPVLDVLARHAEQAKPNRNQLSQLYHRRATCAAALGQLDDAAEEYERAFAADPTFMPTLVGRADVAYRRQDWHAAAKTYQQLAIQQVQSMKRGDAASVYYRLGVARRELGEHKRAIAMFEKAVAIDHSHRDALQAVIDAKTAQGDHDAVIRAKRSLMSSASPEQRVRLLGEIGALYRDGLGNPGKAVSVYVEALEIAPHDHQLLQSVLDAYTETNQWQKAVDTIHRFLDLESNPARRGSYYLAAGVICREELKQLQAAVEHFDKALDNFFEDPQRLSDAMHTRALEAFRAIDEITTQQKDWKQQERAYRRMIKRTKPGSTLLVTLFDSLAEIYRSRLGLDQSAIEAAEVAQSLDPTNTARHKLIAELYLVAGEQSPDKAAEQHHRILRAQPDAYESYRMLRGIYMSTEQLDKAWCVSSTLSFLGKATAEEQKLTDEHRPSALIKAKQHMLEHSWRDVHHPDEDPYITAIFAAIWRGPALLRATSPKACGLKRKDRIDLANDDRMLARVIEYVAQVLHLRAPHVYFQPKQPGTILLANCVIGGELVPSIAVREGLLNQRSRRASAFVVGKMLATLRPEHYLRLALPTKTELKVALMSAIKLVNPDFPVPRDIRDGVTEYLPAMAKHLSPHMREQLALVVTRLLAAAPELDMNKWSHGVDATARRAAFVVCGDLRTAASIVSSESSEPHGPSGPDKVRDLVIYSVSQEYFAIRAQLGLTTARE